MIATDCALQNYIFSTCQTDFLRQVINTLKQYTFFPQNCIEFQGDINDCMYFIYSGEVEVLKDTEDYYKPTRVDILKEGDVFGMIQGLYPLRMHKYSYRAYTLAVVLILHRLDWQHLLDYFPNARHEIYERATSLQFTI
ncbi:hypothetical protein C0J52_06575 [Blattella germanica]|nr:hypothetical protein C0J52_06575 [Blattella germanica]